MAAVKGMLSSWRACVGAPTRIIGLFCARLPQLLYRAHQRHVHSIGAPRAAPIAAAHNRYPTQAKPKPYLASSPLSARSARPCNATSKTKSPLKKEDTFLLSKRRSGRPPDVGAGACRNAAGTDDERRTNECDGNACDHNHQTASSSS
eukprot:scaffold1302_cov114-Isochrysis_galbana.AAC.16